jgi:hypothetical protein
MASVLRFLQLLLFLVGSRDPPALSIAAALEYFGNADAGSLSYVSEI